MTPFSRRVLPLGGAMLGILHLLSAPAMLTLCGCAGEKVRVINPLPDTTWFKVFDLRYFAVNDSAEFNSGLELYWREHFYSNQPKSCRILRYVVQDPDEDTILYQEPKALVIARGDTNYAKSKWLDVADSAVAGVYTLQIGYRHSDRNFVFDTSFDVFPNMFGGSGE